jgi:hypothetical protein
MGRSVDNLLLMYRTQDKGFPICAMQFYGRYKEQEMTKKHLLFQED